MINDFPLYINSFYGFFSIKLDVKNE